MSVITGVFPARVPASDSGQCLVDRSNRQMPNNDIQYTYVSCYIYI